MKSRKKHNKTSIYRQTPEKIRKYVVTTNDVYKKKEDIKEKLKTSSSHSYEDRVKVIYSKKKLYIGLYDGHGNDKVVKYVYNNLLPRLEDISIKDIPGYLVEFDKTMKKRFQNKKNVGGCTMTVIIIKKGVLYCINLGDSPAYLVSKDSVKKITMEHTVTNKKELGRMLSVDRNIQIEDGYLVKGENMIQPTRGLGDYEFKDYKKYKDGGVYTSKPTINTYNIDKYDYLVVSSDGIPDGIGESQLKKYIYNLRNRSLEESVRYIIEKTNKITSRGYKDDLSIVLVKLSEFK